MRTYSETMMYNNNCYDVIEIWDNEEEALDRLFELMQFDNEFLQTFDCVDVEFESLGKDEYRVYAEFSCED